MHIRHDVIHPHEARRSGLTAADRAHNDAINDLGLSYAERSAAIGAIAGHHRMTPAQRDDLAKRSDSYLAERQRLIRGYVGNDARGDERSVPTRAHHADAELRNDAAAAEAAWRKSVANLNARYDGSAEPPARGNAHLDAARLPSARGDAAAAEQAWHDSVARMNARYDRA